MRLMLVTRGTAALARALLILSLFTVLISWRSSVALFATGCLGYVIFWMMTGGLPSWMVPAAE